jgi:hypothetical protein
MTILKFKTTIGAILDSDESWTTNISWAIQIKSDGWGIVSFKVFVPDQSVVFLHDHSGLQKQFDLQSVEADLLNVKSFHSLVPMELEIKNQRVKVLFQNTVN